MAKYLPSYSLCSCFADSFLSLLETLNAMQFLRLLLCYPSSFQSVLACAYAFKCFSCFALGVSEFYVLH